MDWYKPGFKAGGPIRSISNLVNQLHEKVDIYIVTRNTDYLETTPYTTVKTDGWNTVDNAQVYYLSQQNTTAKTIKNLIKEVHPDSVYCNSLFSYYYSLLPIFISKKLNVRIVLAVRGMLSIGSLGVKSRKKTFFLRSAKFIGYFKNVIFHATTLSEKKDIKSVFGTKTVVIVANNLPHKKTINFHEKQKNGDELKLVSVARIAPEKNTLFALETLKNCKNNVVFDIYGPIYNQSYWKKCLELIKELPKNITATYKGVLLPDNIDLTLQNYHALFLPSTGENFGHIIIEAMQNSCIPIISDKTPWRNLEKQKVGFDLSLEKQKLFSEKIDFLSTLSSNEFKEYSQNAFNYVNNKDNTIQDLEDYQQLFKL